ncbi:flavin-containing monooxygenase [Aspergillus stella-maris]|uniref:flavin-containing monooxygenase n=1 Tax=Aspergillus stella-maris TaxID=1810926 RepID=UPI003CCE1994
MANPEYDIVIVGAGFSGIYLLHNLRKHGFSCRIYESGTDLGGVWHSNTYPGARVDSEGWIYQLSIPEAWKDWSFTEKYPSADELRLYFAHLDKTLEIKKDVEFSTTVETADGRVTTCRFLLFGIGFASQRYEPDIPGLDSFKGEVCHTSSWPKGMDVQGKKVAVIGTGASGVQIVQTLAKEVGSMTVFQRTPNLAVPMQQKPLSVEEQAEIKAKLPEIFIARTQNFGGYLDAPNPAKTFDDPAEEREQFYQSLLDRGGFAYLLGGYSDLLIDEAANREAYSYWAKKTRARIHDPRKRDILAPLQQYHPIGAKRCSMETDYFEQYNRENVDVVDLRAPENAITNFTPDGIQTENGTIYPVDTIILASGFDSYTGSFTRIPHLRNTEGVTIAEEWGRDGATSYLGMTRKGYPNMFFAYGVHGPTALSNGPTSIEIQGNWIVDAIQKLDKEGLKYVEPKLEAEQGWKAQLQAIANMTLFVKADSWYMGANIPGKKREMINWPGGSILYDQICRKALEDWEGFVTV